MRFLYIVQFPLFPCLLGLFLFLSFALLPGAAQIPAILVLAAAMRARVVVLLVAEEEEALVGAVLLVGALLLAWAGDGHKMLLVGAVLLAGAVAVRMGVESEDALPPTLPHCPTQKIPQFRLLLTSK